jgi:hypothetical protein
MEAGIIQGMGNLKTIFENNFEHLRDNAEQGNEGQNTKCSQQKNY